MIFGIIVIMYGNLAAIYGYPLLADLLPVSSVEIDSNDSYYKIVPNEYRNYRGIYTIASGGIFLLMGLYLHWIKAIAKT